VLAALVPLLKVIWPDLPWEALVASAVGLLGAGEVAQRYEDIKTLRALYEDSPFAAELRGESGK